MMRALQLDASEEHVKLRAVGYACIKCEQDDGHAFLRDRAGGDESAITSEPLEGAFQSLVDCPRNGADITPLTCQDGALGCSGSSTPAHASPESETFFNSSQFGRALHESHAPLSEDHAPSFDCNAEIADSSDSAVRGVPAPACHFEIAVGEYSPLSISSESRVPCTAGEIDVVRASAGVFKVLPCYKSRPPDSPNTLARTEVLFEATDISWSVTEFEERWGPFQRTKLSNDPQPHPQRDAHDLDQILQCVEKFETMIFQLRTSNPRLIFSTLNHHLSELEHIISAAQSNPSVLPAPESWNVPCEISLRERLGFNFVARACSKTIIARLSVVIQSSRALSSTVQKVLGAFGDIEVLLYNTSRYTLDMFRFCVRLSHNYNTDTVDKLPRERIQLQSASQSAGIELASRCNMAFKKVDDLPQRLEKLSGAIRQLASALNIFTDFAADAVVKAFQGHNLHDFWEELLLGKEPPMMEVLLKTIKVVKETDMNVAWESLQTLASASAMSNAAAMSISVKEILQRYCEDGIGDEIFMEPELSNPPRRRTCNASATRCHDHTSEDDTLEWAATTGNTGHLCAPQFECGCQGADMHEEIDAHTTLGKIFVVNEALEEALHDWTFEDRLFTGL